MQKSRTDPWLVTTIVLAVALIALGVWTVIDRQTIQPQGLASDEVRAILKDRIATFGAEGGVAASAFYADDAILEERDVEPAVVTTEAAHIAYRLEDLRNFGMRLESESTPIQVGRYAAEALSLDEEHAIVGIAVYELDANGKIVHQWFIGGPR